MFQSGSNRGVPSKCQNSRRRRTAPLAATGPGRPGSGGRRRPRRRPAAGLPAKRACASRPGLGGGRTRVNSSQLWPGSSAWGCSCRPWLSPAAAVQGDGSGLAVVSSARGGRSFAVRFREHVSREHVSREHVFTGTPSGRRPAKLPPRHHTRTHAHTHAHTHASTHTPCAWPKVRVGAKGHLEGPLRPSPNGKTRPGARRTCRLINHSPEVIRAI